MTGRLAILLAMLLVSAGSANSQTLPEHPAECRVAEHLVESIFPLPHVASAIKASNKASVPLLTPTPKRT